MCCVGGKVSLTQLHIPLESLKELILGLHPLSKHYLDNARKYNTLFQMTSFGAKQVVEGRGKGSVVDTTLFFAHNFSSSAYFLDIWVFMESK